MKWLFFDLTFNSTSVAKSNFLTISGGGASTFSRAKCVRLLLHHSPSLKQLNISFGIVKFIYLSDGADFQSLCMMSLWIECSM